MGELAGITGVMFSGDFGRLLNAARERGGRGAGHGTAHAAACRRRGLDMHVRDWKEMNGGTRGRFERIASVGATEYVAAEEDAREGRQEEIYRRFFRLCHDLLPDRGRLCLRSVLRRERILRILPLDKMSLKAMRGSDEGISAVLKKSAGSLPPQGVEQLRQAALPWLVGSDATGIGVFRNRLRSKGVPTGPVEPVCA
jgi:cyclopropane-fatty-acyl-phospholipid synthase